MLIEKIKSDVENSRRLADGQVRKNLLVTLYAEALKVGKDKGNRLPSDDEVMATVRQFMKKAQETVDILSAAGRDFSKFSVEISVLSEYLPAQMSNEELRKVVLGIVAEKNLERTPKSMGPVMGALKGEYSGKYDARMASDIVKEVLSH